MTKYFEVHQRDGAARKGKLLLEKTIETPYILRTETLNDINSIIINTDSLWKMDSIENTKNKIYQLRELIGNDRLIILPHMCLTPNAPDIEIPKVPIKDSGAIGRVYRNRNSVEPADLYILEGAGTFENNAQALIEHVINLKQNTPIDTALYIPNICLPENLAILAYMGADILDTTRSTIAAYTDIYLTHAGSFFLDELKELPCKCAVCNTLVLEDIKNMNKKERANFLNKHNINVLDAENILVREKISSGNLREYVEGQCRVKPWLTAVLRLLDKEYEYIEKNMPIVRNVKMMANSGESIKRPEVVRFAQRVHERYTPPALDILLLLPCAAKKPYSISQSHQKFNYALGKYRKFVHEVIITSPLGIVPRELELTYPAAHYDVAVTGYWDAEEMNWVEKCLERYIRKHKYKHIVAHLDGAYKQICENVSFKLGITISYTNINGITNAESLKNLSTVVKELCKDVISLNEKQRKSIMLQSIADYQFGKNAGKILVPEEGEIRGPFPKYQSFYEKKQLATLIPQYGNIAVTIEGAEMMLALNSCIVKIDDFLPKGSILAPGVIHADPEIRPGDEVFIVGSKAIGVGRALMNGEEMRVSTRGQAINLRHVKTK